MRFSFVDRVLELAPGASITTVKCLSMGEEYLADHFPRFPVMPGVLMVEAMTEASAWLVRATEDFAHSLVTLKEARNVRFADFVRPGSLLTVRAEIQNWKGSEVQLKAQGVLEGRTAVSGRLLLACANLADERADRGPIDELVRASLRQRWQTLLPSLNLADGKTPASDQIAGVVG